MIGSKNKGLSGTYASGTVTLGDQCVKVHRRHRAGICRRTVVTHDYVIPAKHEANVSVCMEVEGVPLPPSD